MNTTDGSQSHAARLVDRYLDGRASKVELAELGEILATDAEAARAFAAASRIHFALGAHFAESCAREAATEGLTALLAAREQRQRGKVEAAPVATPFWRGGRARAIAAAAAVALLGSAVALWWRPGADRGQALAHRAAAAPVAGPAAVGAGGPELGVSGSSASNNPLVRAEVRRKLSGFYLRRFDTGGEVPLSAALDTLAADLADLADRHRDPALPGIALGFGDALPDGDPRRAAPVRLGVDDISARDALVLLAGQAGLDLAFADGRAELRPRAADLAPDSRTLRQRRYPVAADFLDRARDALGAAAIDAAPSNPAAAVAYSPAPGAASWLTHDGDGRATLHVRAAADDLPAIATLASLFAEVPPHHVTITAKILQLSPAEAAPSLAAATAEHLELADYLGALATGFIADQIIPDAKTAQRLIAVLGGTQGVQLVSSPAVRSTVGEEAVVSVGGAGPPINRPIAWADLGTQSYLTDKASVALDLVATDSNGDGGRAAPQIEPGALYLSAYLIAQEGDELLGAKNYAEARGKLSEASEMLSDLAASHPDWRPESVEYRSREVGKSLAAAAASREEFVRRVSLDLAGVHAEPPALSRFLIGQSCPAADSHASTSPQAGNCTACHQTPPAAGPMVAHQPLMVGEIAADDLLTVGFSLRDVADANALIAAMAPSQDLTITAHREGESVRVEGSVRFGSAGASAAVPAYAQSMHWGWPAADDWGVVTPQPGDWDGGLAATLSSLDPGSPPPSSATEQVDFDATLASGQALLLASPAEDGTLHLVFLEAKIR